MVQNNFTKTWLAEPTGQEMSVDTKQMLTGLLGTGLCISVASANQTLQSCHRI